MTKLWQKLLFLFSSYETTDEFGRLKKKEYDKNGTEIDYNKKKKKNKYTHQTFYMH